jgi:hypothetical protein
MQLMPSYWWQTHSNRTVCNEHFTMAYCFLTTDLINEYFEKKESKLSLITAGLTYSSFFFTFGPEHPAAKD